jgi:hypothetical protein
LIQRLVLAQRAFEPDIACKRRTACHFVFFAQHVAENGKSGL